MFRTNMLGSITSLSTRLRLRLRLLPRAIRYRHNLFNTITPVRFLSTTHSILLHNLLSPNGARALSPLSPQPLPSSQFYSTSASELGKCDGEVAEKYGFEKVREEFIEECNSKAVLYKHKKTGAEVMSLSNDDENKVFGIVFRTPMNNSTGIAHILRHSVLCGSRKYPLKEPTVELLKGSLHTLLDALVYPDRTCYPVSSTNTKDFYNLMDVYLDAVFFPKCVDDKWIFQQQGWHYELEDPSEPISYKGVVFNMMKDLYSLPDYVLMRTARQALFPDNTYGVNSDGDPKVIPKLTFEEFKEFHRKFYHPSNSRIWFYGDDDPNERLRLLSEYLDLFEASPAPNESKIQPQKLFSKPVRIVKKYPVGDDLMKKHKVSLNWVLSDKPLDLETELAIAALDHVLLGTQASPLRKILLESGLGEAICGGTTRSGCIGGLNISNLQPFFGIGLEGVLEEDIKKVEELVIVTFKKLVQEGFESEYIESCMNTCDIIIRENNYGSFHRGGSLMLRAVGSWIYDMDPFQPFRSQKLQMKLKEKIAKEGSKAVFSPLMDKYILNNPHCVTIEMQPDPEMTARDEAAEKENLEKLKASLTEEDLAELVRATLELRTKQETPDPPEALRSVPRLSLLDIPKKPIHIPTEIGDVNGVTILQHELFTNDIIYSEVVFDLKFINKELLPLVPLFCQSLLEMGTKDMDSVQLNQLIERKTGGISIYPYTSCVRGSKDPCAKLIVQSKSTTERAEDLFLVLNCILQEVQFTDKQRFEQLIFQSIAAMGEKLYCSGHEIAATRMHAKFNTAGWMAEEMGGFSYLQFLKALEVKVEQDWEKISSSLEEIRRSLFSKRHCLVNLTADGKNIRNSEKHIGRFLDLLPDYSVQPNTWNDKLSFYHQVFEIASEVNYVGKAANIFESGYNLNGSADVISKYISNSWLWDRVRVSGGADGSFCDFDTHSGVFTYLSHGDPNFVKTLEVFDGTGDFLRGLEFDNDALTKAIIRTIGDVDAYQPPDAKGYSSLIQYLLGVTDEERAVRREEILSTSLKDFKEFANAADAIRDRGTVVAVTTKKEYEAAKEHFYCID